MSRRILGWACSLGLIIVVFLPWGVCSQSPGDALMMSAKQACILLDYQRGSFNSYWEGAFKRQNQTIATVKRISIAPMAAVGITDRLNFFVSLPYVQTSSSEPNGGQLAGAKGLQDLALALKYRLVHRKTESGGALSFLGTVGFSTPVSEYNPDYMPYSLGLGAPEALYRGIVEYELKSGWYARLAGTYAWRGYARADREYYYNQGSFYTHWMDVPSVSSAELVWGKWLFMHSWQLEINYMVQNSIGGDDIRPYAAPQPTNNSDFGRLGIFSHYYFTKSKSFGLVLYHHRIIHGRNAPELSITGGGINYLFNYLKP